jgi:hypothetical protein
MVYKLSVAEHWWFCRNLAGKIGNYMIDWLTGFFIIRSDSPMGYATRRRVII